MIEDSDPKECETMFMIGEGDVKDPPAPPKYPPD